MPEQVSLDHTIIRHLVYCHEYAKKVLPYLKAEYFQDQGDRLVFERIAAFYHKYNAAPTVEAIAIEFEAATDIPEATYAGIQEFLKTLTAPEKAPDKWLLESTEKFCADQAIYNGVMDSIAIIGNKDKAGRDRGAIPKILTDALGVSFDTHIGHDFLEGAAERYAYYHRQEERIPFDIEFLNLATRGGLPKKTLNIIMAATGVGKSMVMCHMAGHNLRMGKQVLYITMEMAEEEIAKRIDANLLSTNMEDLETMAESDYLKKVAALKTKAHGKLIVKEYPTASAHTGHFRHLINELYLKRDFKPDIIYVDYMNICLSARYKMGHANVNSYSYIKAIAEELRGLAVEREVPIVTATQINRPGMGSHDPELTDTSESIGGPMTADFLVALVSTEELDALNQFLFKQLKNRYNDVGKYRRFAVGVDKAKMRLYDVPNSLSYTSDPNPLKPAEFDKPVFDASDFGRRQAEESDSKFATRRKVKKDYSGLKT